MEITDYLKFLFALLFVLSLMGGLAYALKYFGFGGTSRMLPADKRRLKIVEVLHLDARHRASLLRRDDREHLVILGSSGETVVETNIPAIEKTDGEK
jgi:flagellar protein FliO/FliZ